VSPAKKFVAEIQCVHMLIQVAARVTADDAENHEWIVVKVTRYDRDTNKYEVIDEEPDDDAESGQQRCFHWDLLISLGTHKFCPLLSVKQLPNEVTGIQTLTCLKHQTFGFIQ
jgi:hypothetical protein